MKEVVSRSAVDVPYNTKEDTLFLEEDNPISMI